jgi:hypothetical protein
MMTVVVGTIWAITLFFSVLVFIVVKVAEKQNEEEKKAKLELKEKQPNIQESEFAQFVHSLSNEQRSLLRNMLKL